MDTDVQLEKVRISFDAEPGLKRAVRLEAIRRDVNLTNLLIRLVEEGLQGDEGDGCSVCGAFSHPDRECDFDSERR